MLVYKAMLEPMAIERETEAEVRSALYDALSLLKRPDSQSTRSTDEHVKITAVRGPCRSRTIFNFVRMDRSAKCRLYIKISQALLMVSLQVN